MGEGGREKEKGEKRKEDLACHLFNYLLSTFHQKENRLSGYLCCKFLILGAVVLLMDSEDRININLHGWFTCDKFLCSGQFLIFL